MKEVNRNGDDVDEKEEDGECGNGGGVNQVFGINLNKKPPLSPISNFNRDHYVLQPHQMGTPATQFKVGDEVEVSFERDDSYGVWFPATVIKYLSDNSFVVQYWWRKEGTKTLLQKSTVSSSRIRPPPPMHRKRSFVLSDNVDAFYDFAWTSGVIIEDFNDKKFMVSFKRTDNKMVFRETKLRPHMEWVGGRWVVASQSELADYDASHSRPSKKSKSGNAVEVTTFTACKTDAAKATTLSKQDSSQELKTSTFPECQTDAEKTKGCSLGDKVSVVADSEASRLRPPKKSKSENAAEVTTFTACKTDAANAATISKQDPSHEPKTPTLPDCQTDAEKNKSHSLGDKVSMVADNEASRSRPPKKSKSENAAEVSTVTACKTEAAKATTISKQDPSQEQKTPTFLECQTDVEKTKSRSLGDKVSMVADNGTSCSRPQKKLKLENAAEVNTFTACKTDAAKATTINKQDPSQEQKTPTFPECQTDTEKTKSRSLGDKVSVVADNEASRSRPPKKSKSENAVEVTTFTACKTGAAKAVTISKQDPSKELKTPTSTVCQTDAAATKRHSKVSSLKTVICSLDDKVSMVADNEASRSRPPKKSKSEDAAAVMTFTASKTDAANATRKYKEDPSQELTTPTSTVCQTDAAAPKRPSEVSSSETKSRSLGDKITRGQNVSGLEKDTTKSCKRRGRPPKIRQSSTGGNECNAGGKTAEGTNEIGCETEHIAHVILGLACNGKRSPPDVSPSHFPAEESQTSISDQKGQGNDPTGLVIESPKNNQREQMERSLELLVLGSTIEIPTKSSEKAKPGVSSDQLDKSSSNNGGKTNVVPYDKPHQSTVDEVSLEETEVPAVAISSSRMDIDVNQILPFRKTVTLWETIESTEVFKSIPQKPHFRPLERIDEDCREGLALGHMVTFLNIASKIPKLRVDMPRSSMEKSLENLVVLEDNGFDVKSVRDCLNDLLVKKDKLDLLQNDLKEYESQLVESKNKKADIDKDVDEIDKELEALRAIREAAVSKREIQAAAIAASQSSVDRINENMKSIKSDFEELAAAPLVGKTKRSKVVYVVYFCVVNGKR